jgi:(p)ppGpp synthase/HD superfamily hydrolase
MPKKTILNKMLHLVATKFEGIYDLGGNPYMLHCVRVMQNLNSDDEELNCIALGHDLIEDTDITYDDILSMFGRRVAEGILCLTKYPGMSYEQYLFIVMSNVDAILVKLADLKDNSDITRTRVNFTQKDADRLTKYHKAYVMLSAKLKELRP